MLLIGRSFPASEAAWWRSVVVCGVVAAALVALSADARATEQVVQVKPSDPGATVPLLTAPHTGKNICDLAASTQVTFIKRADHGPHKFASVQVLDGDCAGQDGYVGWHYLDPEPQED